MGSVVSLSDTSDLEDQKLAGLFFINSQASLNGPSVANLEKKNQEEIFQMYIFLPMTLENWTNGNVKVLQVCGE